MPKQLDLAQSTLAEHGMVKGSNALDGDLCTRGNVHGRPGGPLSAQCDFRWPVIAGNEHSHHDAICAFSNDLVNLVVFRDVEWNL